MLFKDIKQALEHIDTLHILAVNLFHRLCEARDRVQIEKCRQQFGNVFRVQFDSKHIFKKS